MAIFADVRYRERVRYREIPARYRLISPSSVAYLPAMAEGPSK